MAQDRRVLGAATTGTEAGVVTIVGSLCSGYGGLDLGLGLALGDVEVAWHVEYDKHPSAILDHHWPGVPNYGDLTTLDHDAMPRVDWLTAGYPCQPFSHAGKRKGSSDERHLWPFVAAAIGALRPPNVLLENVRGHVSLGLDAVLADLAGLGYDARWGLVRASDAGAPHGRARVFIVATDAKSNAGRQRNRDGLPVEVGRRSTRPIAADTYGSGAGWNSRAVPQSPTPIRRTGLDLLAVDDACADVAADAPSYGWNEGRTESAGIIGGPDAAERGRAVATDADGAGLEGPKRPKQEHAGPTQPRAAWGAYEPAVRRWEAVIGRSAPRPTEAGRNGERLSPALVEWMMGLPVGWVTSVPGLARNAQLKALGNGVVPQQAALALRMLNVRAAA